MYKQILVPIDDSILSVRTVSHAVNLAADCGARITFLHVVPDYASSGDGALLHSIGLESFRQRADGAARAILSKAWLAASLSDVECASCFRISDRPFEVILQVAAECDCDLIFMASHGRHGLSRLMIGSQTLKVLAHAGVPVLVDTSESNSPIPARSQALGVIQDEHRTLGVLINELKHLLLEIRDQHLEPDFRLLQAIVFYAREFPLRLHHAKEETYLFAALRKRHPEIDATLQQLEQQHGEESTLVTEMELALEQYQQSAQDGFDMFFKAANSYADSVWAHMTQEEQEILPAAFEYLKEEDWEQIDKAFGENGDPRFDPAQKHEFRELITQIMSRIPKNDEI